MRERLQKIMARAGIASRRRAEDLIVAGAVTVNGQVVTELGSKADPERDHIKVSGKLLRLDARPETLIVHKPDGCVAALSDPAGRQTLRNFLHGVSGRVYPVGGMEYHASGLVLLTSDGALANRLLKAMLALPQTWWLKVKGSLSDEVRRRAQAEAGARLHLQREGDNAWYEAQLPGGKLEKLKNALFRSGHPVEKMRRVKFGPVDLQKLPSGQWRKLEAGEILALERTARRPVLRDSTATAPVQVSEYPRTAMPVQTRRRPRQRPGRGPRRSETAHKRKKNSRR